MSYVRRLKDSLTAFRIGDPSGEYPIWDEGGALKQSGRWHVAGRAVIYASEHYSTAMLEKLVHYRGRLPSNQHYIEITIPAGVSYEALDAHSLLGWSDKDGNISRTHANAWFNDCRSAVLIVPSVVARMERNFVFNCAHPEFALMQVGLEQAVWWDARLFGR